MNGIPRGRVWRVGKWVVVAALGLIAASWALTTQYRARYTFDSMNEIALGQGKIAFMQWVATPSRLAAFRRFRSTLSGWKGFHWDEPPRQAPPASLNREMLGLQLPSRRIVGVPTESAVVVLELPLWIPFVCILIPTIALWYRDGRRVPAGRCRRCGYN